MNIYAQLIIYLVPAVLLIYFLANVIFWITDCLKYRKQKKLDNLPFKAKCVAYHVADAERGV